MFLTTRLSAIVNRTRALGLEIPEVAEGSKPDMMDESKIGGSMSGAEFWKAVMARDRRWDGRFVFAVKSTGIYCRPSCPARRPSRRNVRFFARPEAAEQAGFRACRRCRPKEVPAGAESALVRRACQAIRKAQGQLLNLAQLAQACGVSASRLQRTFRTKIGITPRAYADAVRVSELKTSLRKGGNVTNSLYEAGYGSASRLYEKSNKQLGMTPATYGRGGRGMEIGFSIVDSPLGRLLVAGTERGISAVYLGDSDEKLEQELRQEYPAASIRENPSVVSRSVKNVVSRLSTRPNAADVPLDVQATAFQRKVWGKLQTIPFGSTRTYSQIAREIGRPSAVRAVARACATNPVSIVVPCHRVVREDGNLAGYRWGLDRKKALLDRERELAKGSK